MIQKEKEYLNGIYDLNRKAIRYINSCLSELEIQTWTTVKAALTHYCKGYSECYKGSKRFESNT